MVDQHGKLVLLGGEIGLRIVVLGGLRNGELFLVYPLAFISASLQSSGLIRTHSDLLFEYFRMFSGVFGADLGDC